MIKLRHTAFASALFAAVAARAAIAITGTSASVTVTPSSSSGLEAVYIVDGTDGAVLTYTAAAPSSAANVRWMRFGALGGGYAEELSGATVSGLTSSIVPGQSDMGYIVDDGGRQTAVWVVNYDNHRPTVTDMALSAESDCDRTRLDVTGSFDRIVAYSVNGAPVEIDRQVQLRYLNLVMNGDSNNVTSWSQETQTVSFASVSGSLSVAAPLCDTPFTLDGDRFLRQWGDPVVIATPTYTASRVEARTWATQAERDIPNEQKVETSGLGGSAPCEVTFTAVPSDAVVFREWQFSSTETFDDIDYRFNQDEFTYTFDDYGTTYVRYVCADATGDCEYTGDVYTVTVGESKLVCPNAFSPQNQDGVNDEWKVSYSSLVSYRCNIFSRWGKEVFSSTNPAEGWDGRIGGKFAPAGVYFYVIKAEGADGHKYNLSGDINIVGSRLNSNQTTTE